MDRFHKLYVSFLFVVLGACAAEDPRSLVQVEFEMGATLMGEPAFTPKMQSGLVQSGFCYVVNVTAPDLMESINQGSGSCAYGFPGRGKVFGPFKYGDRAEVAVSAGEKRRFDLVGFPVAAADESCSEKLSFRMVAGKEKAFYGERALDPEGNTDSQNFVYIFQRSAPLALVPGPQKVVMQSLPWHRPAGENLDFPRRYKCEPPATPTLGELSILNAQIDFGGPDTALDVFTVNVQNIGGTEITGLQDVSAFDDGFAYNGGSFPGVGSTCGLNLAPGDTCNYVLSFDPTVAGVLDGHNSTTLTLDYFDGENNQSASKPVQAQKAFVNLTATSSTDFGSVVVPGFDDLVVTVQNTGNVSIPSMGSFNFSAPFSFWNSFPGSGGNCGPTLAPGESCLLGLKFSPIAALTYNGLMNFSLLMAGSAITTPASINLTGTGTASAGP